MPFFLEVETTDVGFTFAGSETEAASTTICIPHGEFSQGTSVNVVSNESVSTGWLPTSTTTVSTVTS